MGMILLRNISLNGSEKDLLIDGERIAKVVAPGLAVPGAAEVMDCRGMTVMPGLVNMHTHAGMAMMRGIGEDVEFHEWLDRIWEIEKNLDEEYVYHATRVACLEMIKTGTTCFNDQYWFAPMACRAASELGLRCALSAILCDRDDPQLAQQQQRQCLEMYEMSKLWPSTVKFVVSVHAIYSVTESMILWASEFVRKNNLLLHIHLSETEKEVEDCKAEHGGMSPVEYLESLGVLGPEVIAAHTLWLSDNDVEILGRRGVTCVHNVNSNLKLASGYKFRYNELRDAGANVCLGTDGCGSSNNLDMLETMKTSAMIQKAWRGDSAAMPINEIIDMVTLNPAKALKLETGRIEEGALADIIIIDTENYHFMSSGTFEANLIYSAHSDCVDSLICGGRFLMKNRVVPGEKEILSQAKKCIDRIK